MDAFIETVSGLSVGLLSTFLLNPYDRAIYLHITKHRTLLDRRNWRGNPYQGVTSALASRCISSGLYFSMQSYYMRTFSALLKRNATPSSSSRFHDVLLNTATGVAVGCNTAILLSPLSAVKYALWGREDDKKTKARRGATSGGVGNTSAAAAAAAAGGDQSLWRESKHMWHRGGLRAFTPGLAATCVRDSLFSTLYFNFRPSRPDDSGDGDSNGSSAAAAAAATTQQHPLLDTATFWVKDMLVVGIATVFSGPANLVRNRQFRHATMAADRRAASAWHILGEFTLECAKMQTNHGTARTLRFVQHQLSIGHGTLRVCVGMSVGRSMFEYIHPRLKKILT